MKTRQSLIVLIAPSHALRDRHWLRDLFRDLHHEQIRVLPLLPFSDQWYRKEWFDRFSELDDDEWPYSYRWSRDHRDWSIRYPELHDELTSILRALDRRGPGTVVLLVPFGEEEALDLQQLRDLVRDVEPAAIVDLSIGETDRHLAERVPEARAFNYPADRDELFWFLRSFTGEHTALHVGSRTADQERPKITVAHPEAIAPSCWSTVEVFLYLRAYRTLVQKEISRLQAQEALDYSNVSSEFPKSLPIGCTIRISLQSDSLHTNPSELTINWYEPYNRLPFRLSPIDKHKEGYSAALDIDVLADDLPVASMRLAIAVKSSVRAVHATRATSDAVWYEDIFASYAREDLGLVKRLKERYEALGLYMFIDLDDLRSGAQWQSELSRRIDKSDLFQLFWSDHARQSEHVTLEWKHALSASEAKGGRFIRPVYWEDPIPPVPIELAGINFRRIRFPEP